jgi:hypothetical protein
MSDKREILKPLVGKKFKSFLGTVYEIREDPTSEKRLVMLVDIYLVKTGAYIDHVWVYYSKSMETAGVNEGHKIQFEARAYEYTKWSKTNNLLKRCNIKVSDYGLKSVRKVQILNGETINQVANF